jgi:hypothetical protein
LALEARAEMVGDALAAAALADILAQGEIVKLLALVAAAVVAEIGRLYVWAAVVAVELEF